MNSVILFCALCIISCSAQNLPILEGPCPNVCVDRIPIEDWPGNYYEVARSFTGEKRTDLCVREQIELLDPQTLLWNEAYVEAIDGQTYSYELIVSVSNGVLTFPSGASCSTLAANEHGLKVLYCCLGDEYEHIAVTYVYSSTCRAMSECEYKYVAKLLRDNHLPDILVPTDQSRHSCAALDEETS